MSKPEDQKPASEPEAKATEPVTPPQGEAEAAKPQAGRVHVIEAGEIIIDGRSG